MFGECWSLTEANLSNFGGPSLENTEFILYTIFVILIPPIQIKSIFFVAGIYGKKIKRRILKLLK